MNILVIGNGFDIAHNLPTKYGEFIDFIDFTKLIYNGKKAKSVKTEGFKNNLKKKEIN